MDWSLLSIWARTLLISQFLSDVESKDLQQIPLTHKAHLWLWHSSTIVIWTFWNTSSTPSYSTASSTLFSSNRLSKLYSSLQLCGCLFQRKSFLVWDISLHTCVWSILLVYHTPWLRRWIMSWSSKMGIYWWCFLSFILRQVFSWVDCLFHASSLHSQEQSSPNLAFTIQLWFLSYSISSQSFMTIT